MQFLDFMAQAIIIQNKHSFHINNISKITLMETQVSLPKEIKWSGENMGIYIHTHPLFIFFPFFLKKIK